MGKFTGKRQWIRPFIKDNAPGISGTLACSSAGGLCVSFSLHASTSASATQMELATLRASPEHRAYLRMPIRSGQPCEGSKRTV